MQTTFMDPEGKLVVLDESDREGGTLRLVVVYVYKGVR